MAIITNSSIKELRKSLDGFTYRNLHGQTVVSRKISSNPSNTKKQFIHRQSFAKIQKIASELMPFVETGFEGSTPNIRRQGFLNKNRDLLGHMKETYVENDNRLYLEYVIDALESPLFFGKISASSGEMQAITHFNWNENHIPKGDILLSVPFKAADEIVVTLCYLFVYEGELYSIMKTDSFTLGNDDIAGLEDSNYLAFDSIRAPFLKSFVNAPLGAVITRGCMAAVVHRGKRRSTSYFSIVEMQR